MRHIDMKRWSEYNDTEKKELLKHWFYYFGKSVYTLQEMMDYSKLVEEHADEIFLLAVIGYCGQIGSNIILNAMRNGKAEEVLKQVSNIKIEEKDKAEFESIKSQVLAILVDTYNNPEPAKPLDPEELGKQLRNMFKDDDEKN